jgi:Uma2 family endonuclease
MNRVAGRRRLPPCDDIPDFYPSSDGEPMAETGIHVMTILMLFQALEDFFRDRRDVYLAANQFWYWEEGNPTARRSPDVMVVPGIGNRFRDSLMSWREGGAVPSVIFEITSKSTWRIDIKDKFPVYEKLGVNEYFIFDPIDRCLRPRLQGYRLNRKKHRKMRQSADGSLESQHGFRVRPEGTFLRLAFAATGETILTRAEQVEQAELAAEQAQAKLESERAARKEEQARAEEQRVQAEEERARADRLQAELERLKRQIHEYKRNGT